MHTSILRVWLLYPLHAAVDSGIKKRIFESPLIGALSSEAAGSSFLVSSNQRPTRVGVAFPPRRRFAYGLRPDALENSEGGLLLVTLYQVKSETSRGGSSMGRVLNIALFPLVLRSPFFIL